MPDRIDVRLRTRIAAILILLSEDDQLVATRIEPVAFSLRFMEDRVHKRRRSTAPS